MSIRNTCRRGWSSLARKRLTRLASGRYTTHSYPIRKYLNLDTAHRMALAHSSGSGAASSPPLSSLLRKATGLSLPSSCWHITAETPVSSASIYSEKGWPASGTFSWIFFYRMLQSFMRALVHSSVHFNSPLALSSWVIGRAMMAQPGIHFLR